MKPIRNSALVTTVLSFSLMMSFTGCRKKAVNPAPDERPAAYDREPDWNDPQKMISLDYEQSQGKRIFYQECVWCHADATPAGPSNRSNLTPVPPLANDGSVLNGESDEFMRNIVTLGGSAIGKSAMMPPYGQTLSPEDVRAVIAFIRVIAQPPYQTPARSASQSARQAQ
jgi:mono/diheme cytochrome c family protein